MRQERSKPSLVRLCDICGAPYKTWPYLVRQGYGRYCKACRYIGKAWSSTTPDSTGSGPK